MFPVKTELFFLLILKLIIVNKKSLEKLFLRLNLENSGFDT